MDRMKATESLVILLLVLIPVALLAVPLGVFLHSIRPTSCEFEMFGDSPHLQIPETPWVIDEWGQACGFGVSGGMEIRASNSTTQESQTILEFNDIVGDTKMTTDGPKTLVIIMPNRVDFDEVDTHLADVAITYKFTPKDDPDERANFRRWHRNPGDALARDWACRNIYAKMDSANGSFWNQFFGERYPANKVSPPVYCTDERSPGADEQR
jgi:hypothetical protein